jgi:glycosyltransferase involved in cell wall biosynthesis
MRNVYTTKVMKENPLISVVMPAYNSSKFIGEAAESALKQTYQNIELIIVDDGSTDNTLAVAEDLSDKDKRVKVYSIPPAGRPSVPRNYAISKAEGEYIAFLDSDDVWTKNKLKDQLDVLRNNPDAGFVYSVSKTFGDVNLFSPYYEVLPLFFRAARRREDLLKIGNTIPLSSTVVKAELLREAGGFDEDPELKVEDYDLWLRLSSMRPFIFIPKLHVYYRIHSGQFSSDWETKKSRLQYLEKKRGIKLPLYKQRRTKGGIYLFIRNVIHFKVYMFMLIKGLFSR